MMPPPFEDPSKTEMRGRCEIAIDQTGHELVENPSKVELPAGAEIQGGLKGDLQSLDGDGFRYCYYLRPGADESLPKWLANLAALTHGVQGAKLYVVVFEVLASFEKSCKVAGAGLLVLTSDNAFQQRLDFDTTLPAELEAEFRERANELRREMEAKLKLNQDTLLKRFNDIGDLTREMPDDVAETYAQNVEREYRLWSEWSERLSTRLDAAFANRSAAELDAIRALIEAGPDLEPDDGG